MLGPAVHHQYVCKRTCILFFLVYSDSILCWGCIYCTAEMILLICCLILVKDQVHLLPLCQLLLGRDATQV